MRKAAADLQGVFVQELYKVMRSSVDASDGLVERSQGEEMFSGLMDERFAADTGTRWHRGLGDAIYRAIRQQAGLAPDTARPTEVPHATPVIPPLASPVRTS